MSGYYADVIVNITHEKLDRTFQYRIPEDMQERVRVGSQVEIPFGNGNRRICGYVIKVGSKARYAPDKIKEILRVDSTGFTVESRLIELAGWMKKTYGSTMIQALKTVLPIYQNAREKKERILELALSEEEAKAKLEYYQKKHQKARARIVQGLLEHSTVPYQYALKNWKASAETLRILQDQGVLRIQSQVVYRNPIQNEIEQGSKSVLTEDQQQVLNGIVKEWDEKNRTCLIHGVTGSGKTLVYMELIDQMQRQGRQVILLIPEISLTYQNVQRFYGRFGSRVTVLHSRMSQSERADQMERARSGAVQIVIGPRSALFTPFADLGLIIIDEEHENSYKSEVTPRYHARETAIERARLEGAHVVLGSATPSLESYHRCRCGEYALFNLHNRYRQAILPTVYSVDMREELKMGNRSILSRRLQEAIEQRLWRGEQSMLFLNRRGYAGFVSCRSCGYVAKCPHCDVSMTVHNNGKMVCHYCGYETGEIRRCPSCGSSYIGGFRAGTQQIEQIVKKRFPQARVMRMDLDTTRGKEGYQKILEAFANQEADILIGTQMIVKGHDFPHVTLMGVLLADLSLYAADYRAAERTYQLLVQAVGRAGRGELPGEAVIQTYHPEHYGIVAALKQDYEAFYEEEIAYRRLLGYPPEAEFLAIHASCGEESLLEQAMGFIYRYLCRIRGEDTQIIGPAKEPVSKINDRYRSVLYIRQQDREELLRIREKLEHYIEINHGFDSIFIQFDINT